MQHRKSTVLLLSAALSILLCACAGSKPAENPKTDIDHAENTDDTENTDNTGNAGNASEGTEDTDAAAHSNDDAANGSAEALATIPEEYHKEINGITFDMSIEMPQNIGPDALLKSTITLQVPDKDKALQAIAPQKEKKEEENGTGNGEGGKEFATYRCTFADESTLSTDLVLLYNTPFFDNVWDAFRVEKTSKFNADKYSQTQPLNFMAPEDAFENIKKMINNSGYTIEGMDYSWYALDAATMEQEEMRMGKSGEILEEPGRDWSSEDDCYYFWMEQTHEGIPVYFGDENYPEDSTENRPIQAVYSTRGLEHLMVYNVYDFTPLDETYQLKEFDAAAECVASKYGDILTGADYKVTRAKLYLMPRKDISGNYEVKLAWLFEVHESGKDSETGEDFENVLFTFVDAETGEDIPL